MKAKASSLAHVKYADLSVPQLNYADLSAQRIGCRHLKSVIQGSLAILTLTVAAVLPRATIAEDSATVTVMNFVRAETDYYNSRSVAQFGLGRVWHLRVPTPIEEQNVIRMNRDTIYSMAVLDLASPVTVSLPETGGRYLSMQVINQDHFTIAVEYGPGTYRYTREDAGTRYLSVIVRIFMNPNDETDIAAANDIQDKIVLGQAESGQFEVPDWDEDSLSSVRGLLLALGATASDSFDQAFGSQTEVDPVMHLLGTAAGWGGLPRRSAMYPSVFPEQSDGQVPHSLTVGKVPVDGFWSITVYNAAGFMEQNALGANSFNSITSQPNADGSTTIHFGACEDGRANCLPIMKGWNYTVRLYQPSDAVLSGDWTFPPATPLP